MSVHLFLFFSLYNADRRFRSLAVCIEVWDGLHWLASTPSFVLSKHRVFGIWFSRIFNWLDLINKKKEKRFDFYGKDYNKLIKANRPWVEVLFGEPKLTQNVC